MRVWRVMAAPSSASRPLWRSPPSLSGVHTGVQGELERPQESLGASSVRKSRKRKSDEREPSILGLAKTSKPFADHKSVKPLHSGSLSEDHRLVASTVDSDESLVILGERTIDLEKAIPRRRSWTPVADHASNLPAEPAGNGSPDASSNESSAVFGTLSNRYDYSTAAEASNRATSNSSASLSECTRRRKVELAHASVQPKPPVEVQSVPKPKKRPLTITDKATELYRRQSGHGSAETSVASPIAANATDTVPKGKQRRRKVKAATAVAPRILSHEESYRAFESQDLLFGTSSQLAREESPSTVRDLQKAISLSLATVPEVEQSGAKGIALDSQSLGSQSSLALARSSRRLWAEASRDHAGSTVQPEVIDLTDSPYGMARLNLHNSPLLQRQSLGEVSAINIGNGGYEPPPAVEASAPSKMETLKTSKVPPVAASSTGTGTKNINPPTRAGVAVQPRMPDYSTWTDEALQRAIASYGFKKMRVRKNMIGRLEKCWQSLHPGVEVQPVAPKPTEAPRKRGRPKKTQTTEEDGAAPLAVEAEPATDVPAADQTRLFAKIHEAIVTAKSPDEPAELSWHAKMLLYDPIIIEDLTVWLNAGHLTRVGVDEEVAPRDVRDWCESRSVCCLWRLNLRGGVRIRF